MTGFPEERHDWRRADEMGYWEGGGVAVQPRYRNDLAADTFCSGKDVIGP